MSELNKDQEIVLEMLKEETIDRGNPYAGIYWLLEKGSLKTVRLLTTLTHCTVLALSSISPLGQ